MLKKGNTVLVVLLLAAVVLGAGGFYFYSKGNLKTNLIPESLNQTGGIFNLGSDNASPESESSNIETGTTKSDKIFLTINSPKNGDLISSKTVTLTGKTNSNADVFVNDLETKADANGNFSITLNLDEGVNAIIVSANDSDGNAVEQDLSVNIQTF